jgi:hypothetical protein
VNGPASTRTAPANGSPVPDLNTAASARNAEGVAVRAKGRLEWARTCHLEARDIYTDTGASAGVAFSESCLGFLAAETGDDALARDHHRAAFAAAVDSGQDRALALALEGIVASTPPEDVPEQQATLLGGARGLWATVEQVEPSHRDDVEVVADRVREAVEGPAFEDAFTRGAAMEATDLVAIARTLVARHR